MSGTTKILQPEPIERCPFGGTAEEEAAYSLALDSLEKISSVLAEKPFWLRLPPRRSNNLANTHR